MNYNISELRTCHSRAEQGSGEQLYIVYGEVTLGPRDPQVSDTVKQEETEVTVPDVLQPQTITCVTISRGQ